MRHLFSSQIPPPPPTKNKKIDQKTNQTKTSNTKADNNPLPLDVKKRGSCIAAMREPLDGSEKKKEKKEKKELFNK